MIAMTPSRVLPVAFAAACCLALTASSEAGIVVTKKGLVLVGTIRAGETTSTRVVVHNVRGQKGKIDVPMHEVRWMDADGETLTDAYFRDHLDESLQGNSWRAVRERWKIAQQPIEELQEPVIFVGGGMSRIDSIPTTGHGFSICKPTGWRASVERDITMFKNPKAQRSGYTGRIHVFSVQAVEGSHSDQIEWIRKELARVSAGAGFDIKELKPLVPVAGGADQTLVTKTTLGSHTVIALRKVCFRTDRTYFFAAYADEAEFQGLRGLMEASLETLEVDDGTK